MFVLYFTFVRILIIPYLVISSHPCISFISLKLLGIFVPIFYVEDFTKMSGYLYFVCTYVTINIEKMIGGSEYLGKDCLQGWFCLRMVGCPGFSLETSSSRSVIILSKEAMFL